MKLTIPREVLLAASSRAVSFTSRKNIIPILSHALVHADDNGLTISATDMEKQITERTEADVSEPGSVVLPIAQVAEITKKLPTGSTVSIVAENEQVTIKSGRFRTVLNTLPVDDFPAFNETETSCEFTVSASVLRSQFQRVQFAMSNEETRYYLNGVYIHTDGDKLKFVATDGHRLAVSRIVGADVKGDLSQGVIIPRGVVSDLSRLLDGDSDVRVCFSDARAVFYVGSAVITSKLVEGSFPDYQRVIPKNGTITAVVPSGVSTVIDRVSAVSSERSRPTKFAFTSNELSLTCRDPNGNEATDVIEIEGSEPLDIGFQARYVQDVLAQVSGDSKWVMSDGSAPAVIRDTGNEDVLFILMPMRV